jgi:hypothetical protein
VCSGAPKAEIFIIANICYFATSISRWIDDPVFRVALRARIDPCAAGFQGTCNPIRCIVIHYQLISRRPHLPCTVLAFWPRENLSLRLLHPHIVGVSPFRVGGLRICCLNELNVRAFYPGCRRVNRCLSAGWVVSGSRSWNLEFLDLDSGAFFPPSTSTPPLRPHFLYPTGGIRIDLSYGWCGCLPAAYGNELDTRSPHQSRWNSISRGTRRVQAGQGGEFEFVD